MFIEKREGSRSPEAEIKSTESLSYSPDEVYPGRSVYTNLSGIVIQSKHPVLISLRRAAALKQSVEGMIIATSQRLVGAYHVVTLPHGNAKHPELCFIISYLKRKIPVFFHDMVEKMGNQEGLIL